MEDIKQIPGRPNYYATRDGRILSKKREEDCYLKLVPRFNKLTVTLFYDHMMRCEFVNRLVLEAFVGFPADPWLCFANHKDGDPMNCSLDNLEWLVAETTEDYDPEKSHRKGVLRPDAVKKRMTEAKYHQSEETKRKIQESRKRYYDKKRREKEGTPATV